MSEELKSLIAKELMDLGYQTDQQKRGLVKWINSTLAILLFISLSANFTQWVDKRESDKTHYKQIVKDHDDIDKLNDRYLGVFLEMLNKQEKTDNKIDTTSVLLNAAKH